MKKLIKDWWPLLLIAGWLLWKRHEKRKWMYGQAPSNPTDPVNNDPPTSQQQNPHAGGSVITYNGKTYYTGGPPRNLPLV